MERTNTLSLPPAAEAIKIVTACATLFTTLLSVRSAGLKLIPVPVRAIMKGLSTIVLKYWERNLPVYHVILNDAQTAAQTAPPAARKTARSASA